MAFEANSNNKTQEASPKQTEVSSQGVSSQGTAIELEEGNGTDNTADAKGYDGAFFGFTRDEIQPILDSWGWPNGVGHPDIETEAAIHLAFKSRKYRIGEIAVHLGVITESEVQEVLAEQSKLKVDMENGRVRGVSNKGKFIGMAADMFASVASAGKDRKSVV